MSGESSKIKDFVKAQSDNLPNVDAFMLMEFIRTNDCFNAAEIRGIKADMSMRDNYINNAVGYVRLKRDNGQCIVQCEICPEHRVRSKNYHAVMIVNEEDDTIVEVKCQDCPASEGGCKHALAFLMWVHKQSCKPSPTTVECYWKKPKLSGVGTTIPFVSVSDFGSVKSVSKVDLFFQEFVEEGQKYAAPSQILKHFDDRVTGSNILSLHQLLYSFALSSTGSKSYEDFIEYSKQRMTRELCNQALIETRDQSKNHQWFELRYGRITASKIYGVACCKKIDGSLVKNIIGAHKIQQTTAMKRGLELEDEVMKTVEKKIGKKIQKAGLYLNNSYPEFGASPDGILEDFVVEIKCPSSEKSYSQYILKSGKVSAKCYAQIQMQMYFAEKKKCLFCVAHPNFENTNNVNIVEVEYDEMYTDLLFSKARLFWKNTMFNMLLQTVS